MKSSTFESDLSNHIVMSKDNSSGGLVSFSHSYKNFLLVCNFMFKGLLSFSMINRPCIIFWIYFPSKHFKLNNVSKGRLILSISVCVNSNLQIHILSLFDHWSVNTKENKFIHVFIPCLEEFNHTGAKKLLHILPYSTGRIPWKFLCIHHSF